MIIIPYNFIGYLSTYLQEPFFSLNTFFDDLIPFIPIFVFPYISLFFLLLATIFFSFRKKITTIELISFHITQIMLLISCYIIYLIFPTTSSSIMVNLNQYGDSLTIKLITILYNLGVPFNAFPSYHVAPLVFIALFTYHKWRKLFWISLPFNIASVLSTVFIKYHFFVDILGGIGIGYFAYYVLYKKVALKYLNKFIKIK